MTDKIIDETVNINFRVTASKKTKLEYISAKNNRTLSGQLNALCDVCIQDDEKTRKGAKGKKA